MLRLWTNVSKLILFLLVPNKFGDCIGILEDGRRVGVRICPSVLKIFLRSQFLS